MGKSKIEWTEMTWNPVTGCTKVSAGCKHCYAERQWPRLRTGRPFTEVNCHPDRLQLPLHWRKPRRIFVNSMSDLFHDDVSDEFIDHVFAVMALCPQHQFQILTKRPERMCDYLLVVQDDDKDFQRWSNAAVNLVESPCAAHIDTCAWPLPNVWLGVSAEDQATADERIPLLLQTLAAVRWVSAEPLLGPMIIKPEYLHKRGCPQPSDWGVRIQCSCHERIGLQSAIEFPRIDWIVCGGESGPHARPMHPDWARSLRDQCLAAGASFFMKQLSGERGKPIKDIAAFPADLQIREYPV